MECQWRHFSWNVNKNGQLFFQEFFIWPVQIWAVFLTKEMATTDIFWIYIYIVVENNANIYFKIQTTNIYFLSYTRRLPILKSPQTNAILECDSYIAMYGIRGDISKRPPFFTIPCRTAFTSAEGLFFFFNASLALYTHLRAKCFIDFFFFSAGQITKSFNVGFGWWTECNTVLMLVALTYNTESDKSFCKYCYRQWLYILTRFRSLSL